jgi:hypothetical protein
MHPPPDRPLCRPEEILWWLDRGAPLHFVTVVDLDGPLPPDTLAKALAAAAARHPALRSTLCGSPEALRFAPREGPLPLAQEARPEAEWAARLETELATPMPALGGPLLRTTLLSASGTRHRLLLALHHAIGDGRGGIWLARDVLSAAAGQVLEALPPAPTLDATRPARHRGLRALGTALATVARDLARALRFGRPRTMRVDVAGPLDARRPQVHSLVFAPPVVEALTTRARAAGTTVHGLMSAVLLQAVAAESGGVVPLSCGSPVDLRPHLEPRVGEDLGYYVGLSQGAYRVDPAADPLPLARAIRRDLVRDLARGVPTKFHEVASLLFRGLRRGRTPAAFAAAMYALPVRATTGITNLGRLTVPSTYGPLRTTALFFAVMPSGLADFVTTATCHDGHLRWTFTALAPAIDPERASALANDVARRLRALA